MADGTDGDRGLPADTETLQVREKPAKIPGALFRPQKEINAKALTQEEDSLGAMRQRT